MMLVELIFFPAIQRNQSDNLAACSEWNGQPGLDIGMWLHLKVRQFVLHISAQDIGHLAPKNWIGRVCLIDGKYCFWNFDLGRKIYTADDPLLLALQVPHGG